MNQQVASVDVEPQESDDLRDKRMAIIEAFSEIIKDKRKDFIEGRRASGIEKDWQEDEDHYAGVDVANKGSNMQKGRSPTDGMRENSKKDVGTRSTVFLKITRPYVDAAAARVSDMLLPTDDRNFAIKCEPRPELTAIIKNAERPPAAELPPQQPAGGLRGMMAKMMGGQQQPANPGQPDVMVVEAKQAIAKTKASAERAQEEIDDWLVQCSYHAEVRKVIEGAAKVGTGILKGPLPVQSRHRTAKKDANGWTVEMIEKIDPTSKFVNHWNFFPDPSCGDDIQKGSGTFECDDITARRLIELKADKTYIAEMIDLCIEEGPTDPVDGTRRLKEGEKTAAKELFQIWYYYGQVSKKDMEAAGCKCSDKEMYPCMVTMVNDRVIKVTLSALDSGEFPYDIMVWQARAGYWAGEGVSRQMRECQKGANAAVRNLMDNAGLSAGPQIIVNRNKIVPANGRWELTPRKVWYTKADEDVEDVSKAFTVVNIETRQSDLMAILMFWLKEAEDVTGLPMLLQGQQGSAPDTARGTEIVNNNGSTVLRRIARTFDDKVTEPHIGRYYEWLLLYGPDEAKGQFTIDARGSSALVERSMQVQYLTQMIGMSLNPAYGLDPELVISEFLKSLRFDSKALALTDEKKQEMASRPPPEDPRITAAKITQEGAAAREQTKAKTAETNLMASAQIEKSRQDFQAMESQKDRQLEAMRMEVDAKLAREDITSEERIALEREKVLLAKVALQLKVQERMATNAEMHQKDLAVGNHMVALNKPSPQVATPAVEPAGRAQPGQAFTQ